MHPSQLKRHRHAMGMSQVSFADKLRTAVANVRNWEQGRRKVPAWVDEHIALLEQNRSLQIKLLKRGK